MLLPQNETWCDLDWKGPIELLALEQCDNLDVHRFVQKFTKTLRTLVLKHMLGALAGLDDGEVERPFVLPELKTLELEDRCRQTFLRAFRGNGCPKLEMLEVGEIRGPEQFVELISELVGENVIPSLKKLSVMETMELDDSQKAVLEEICEGKVDLEIGTPA